MKFETLALHAGHTVDGDSLSRAVPVYRTSAYLFRSTKHAADLFALKEAGNIYTRIGNPTQAVLEERFAALEGGAAAVALASGTSAIFYAIINICRQGDELVAANNLYGGTYSQFDSILPQFGIKVHLVDPSDPDNFAHAITERTRALYCETLGNPALNMTDIQAVADIAHRHGLPLIVDSTFTPPCLFRPIEHGADIVVHSLTKWIGGHGTGIGGIVVDAGTFDWSDPRFTLYNEPDHSYHGLRYAHDLGEMNRIAFALRLRLVPLRNLGACISPDNAWLFLQGIETLALRMERHSANGQAAAAYLHRHPAVAWVNYPGLPGSPGHETARKYLNHGYGGMVAFGIRGGTTAGSRFIEGLRLFSHLANVGDAKSLAIHPASTTHSQLSPEQLAAAGIDASMIRLSIGIEHIDDILADLAQALDQAIEGQD
ncbi:O-acetylhomoserine aminocarboxypropyltransferase/cysteine synthase [Desulfoprunum benzoelyticum]|uniref:O-acetylhomoserine (Thiol)-lyase n=1 Tax=Desulfoprunum benzoelyticum TaxID=1506996 RepID=A0A840V6R0_9BACT|nr:O-acetylhomoserine aminocarboxypropyltransferase/cysteine synthase family protein [Desulfoprunum benzoelyticum]MBB5349439.1 O-acetylhomoserine (thiol)-lyase [Desulfoprunum benzoelyticum]MBM9531704.1 O-acetylhomoserine aminocarboxypropyltransferase/cysteine synthase [Desulfoprunum benzoelyticum]